MYSNASSYYVNSDLISEMSCNNYYKIPVRQSCPVHPCTQVQFSGAVQFMFKPQPPVQIAGHDTVLCIL